MFPTQKHMYPTQKLMSPSWKHKYPTQRYNFPNYPFSFFTSLVQILSRLENKKTDGETYGRARLMNVFLILPSLYLTFRLILRLTPLLFLAQSYNPILFQCRQHIAYLSNLLFIREYIRQLGLQQCIFANILVLFHFYHKSISSNSFLIIS